MTRAFLLSLSGTPTVALLLALTACGEPAEMASDPDAGSPMLGDAGPMEDSSVDAIVAPMLSAALAEDALRVVRGQSATVGLSIVREGDVGPVVVAASELPAGVALAPVTVPSTIDEVPLVLEVTGAALHGGPVSLEVEVSPTASMVEPVTLTLSLTVAGRPGTLDESFGDAGVAVTNLGASFYHPDFTVDSVGRVVVTGRTPYFDSAGEPFTMVVRRLARDGGLDRSFGARGTLRYGGDFGTEGTSVVVARNHAVRAIGAHHQDEGGMTVERFVLDLDRFGGILSGATPIPGFNSALSLVFSTTMGEDLVIYSGSELGALRSDGRFDPWTISGSSRGGAASCVGAADGVTCGLSQRSTEEVPIIAQLDQSGEPDVSFGRDGLLEWPSPLEGRATVFALPLSLLEDGGGYAFVVHRGSERLSELVRFGADGLLDEAFGDRGRVELGADPVWIADMAVDGQGRLVVLGRFGPSEAPVSQVRRYTTVGNLDPTFGMGGVVELDAIAVSDLGFIEYIEDGDRLVGCNSWSEEGILRCYRLWL